MSATTIRVDFAMGPRALSLAARNEKFRRALLRFEPRPAVLLLRDGYAPLPLAEAGDADAMFCEAIQITGTLKVEKVIVP